MTKKNALIAAGAVAILIVAFFVFRKEPRGALLFERERCNECHMINGKGGGVGPDLTYVGRRRSRDYIISQVKNPKAHNPDSVMPSFAHLPEQDLRDLADYLSSLK
jgi:mono/diheme cytochrome c family protein